MKKIFLLGVGAQKSGTSWLHQQLSNCANIDMGFTKEYHVFDALFSEHCERYKRKLTSDLFNPELNLDKELIRKKIEFVNNPSSYFDYFDLLIECNPAIELVGDITPSYSMLNAEHFSFIKKGLTDRGFEIKVLFIMRDPLQRAWSMLRMNRANIKNKNINHQFKTNEEQALLDSYKMPDSVLRTKYDRTILELEKVFTPAEIFYGFYETFFTSKSYSALSGFLDIQLNTPDFHAKINSVKESDSLSSNTKKEIVDFYQETYRFVENKFQSEIKDIWQGFKILNSR